MLFDNTVLYKQRRIFFFQRFPHNVWKKTIISYLINRNKTFILRFQRKHLKRFIALKRFITLLCIITEKENMFQQMEWQSNRNRIFTRKQIIKKTILFKCQERDFFISYKDKWSLIFSPVLLSFIFISQPGKVQKVWRLRSKGVLRQEVKNC